MTLQIVEVLGRAKQGITLPFKCRAEDGEVYYVKGRGAARRSLIAEYLCGHLGQAFGLPIPSFEIVDVPEPLIEYAQIADIAALGSGLAFGSCAVPHVQELNYAQLAKVDISLSRNVLMFDWWVRNADRTLTAHGGNPNLLWDQQHSKLVVIDHNQAFDEDFDPLAFAESHVFNAHLPAIFEDMLERDAYTNRLSAAFEVFEQACDNLPEEWFWADDGVPAQFNIDAARELLSRFNKDDFWRIAR